MGQVKVTTATVRKKEPVSKPQPKVEARRVVVNNQVQRLHTAAASSNRTNITKSTYKPRQPSSSTSRSSSKRAVKRLSQAKKQSRKTSYSRRKHG